MKKHFAALFAGVGVSVLVGFGLYGARNRRQIANEGRELVQRVSARGRKLANRGRELVERGRAFAGGRRRSWIDLNEASVVQLLGLGLDRNTVDRIIENRPYRSKLELISRVMLPSDIYSSIKNKISVSRAQEGVKVAS